jgi:hypothetical protein
MTDKKVLRALDGSDNNAYGGPHSHYAAVVGMYGFKECFEHVATEYVDSCRAQLDRSTSIQEV